MWTLPALPPELQVRLQAEPVSVRQEKMDDRLVVEWTKKSVDAVNEIVIFENGVKATYGPTTLFADRLELDLKNKTGKAFGNIRLIDPEGTLTGQSLEFNWATRTGRAKSAIVELAGLKLMVEDIDIQTESWVLRRVKIGGSDRNGDALTFRARELTIKPGEVGRAVRPGLGIGDWVIAPLPLVTFSLDERAKGLELPTLSWRRRVGFGLNYEVTQPFSPRGVYGGTFNAFPNSRPSLSLLGAISLLKSDEITTKISPRDDLDEPFNESYYDNVSVRSPFDESKDLHGKKATLAALAGWNLSTRARPVDFNTVNRAWDFVGEFGDSNQWIGGVIDFRYQKLREETPAPAKQRFSTEFSLSTIPVQIAPRTMARLRLDGFGTTGYGDQFGWLRAQLGMTHALTPNLLWSGAVAGAVESGRAPFRFDPLVAKNTASTRIDWRFGNYHLNLMMRADLDRRSLLSREASFSFVAGAFEPFIAWREFPSDIRIGFQFRGNAVFDRLKQRSVSRATPTQAEPKNEKLPPKTLLDKE